MPQPCRHIAAILARDRGIIGLPLLFDTDALVARLNSAIGGPAVHAAQLVYLRYKPGTNCLAKYHLHTESGPIDVYAKAYGEGISKKLAKDRKRLTVDGPFGSGRHFFADSGVVVSTFPNDAKLPCLAHLGDSATREQQLAQILDTPDMPPVTQWQALAYKPERRYVVKVSWPDKPDTAAKYVIKYVTAQEYTRVLTTARYLNAHRVTGVPQLVGASSRHHALAFSWQDGAGLREVTSSRDIAYRHLVTTGRALAEFHHQTATIKTFPSRDFAARLQALSEQIAFLLPSLTERMNTLVRRLGTWWRDQNEACGVVHGDFYDKQVVFTADSAGILDIDSVESGHPARDLGLFIAHLERDAISGRVDATKITELGDALLHGYVSAGEPVPTATLRAYTALGLAQLVHHPFRSYERDWPDRTEQILNRALTLLDSAGVTAVSTWSTVS